MLLQQENWRHGYNQILSDCQPSSINNNTGGTVLILCNPDADALCAARILSYALRADKVPYQLRPCGGFQRLLEILKRLYFPSSGNDDDNDDGFDDKLDSDLFGSGGIVPQEITIRAIILLNLGAARNLQNALFSPTFERKRNTKENRQTGGILDDDDSTATGDDDNESTADMNVKPSILNPNLTKVYILDSHRPYHLANVHAGKNIVLLNDYDMWHHQEGGIPSDGSGLSGEEESEEEEDDDEEEGRGSSGDEGEIEFGDEEDSVSGEAQFDDEDSGVDDDKVAVSSDDDAQFVQQEEVDPGYEGQEEEDQASHDDELNESDDESPVRKRNATQSSYIQTKRQRQDDTEVPSSDNDNDDNLEELGGSQKRKDRIRLYYTSGSFYSSPIAFMAYTLLSTQLRHGSVGDLLWLACVGVTDAYIHNRLDMIGYVKLAKELKNHVDRVYPSPDNAVQRSANTFHAEDLYRNTNDVSSHNNNNEDLTRVGTSENGKIVTEDNEFRFFLLRHTSLWNAMCLSSDVNTKMELWTSSGTKKLKEMLAKMGLPLVQCQQPYAFMKARVKRRLKTMITDHAEDYGLANLSYTGFVRVTGYKSLLSAGDMSLAVTALLECEHTTPYKNTFEEQDNGQTLQNIEAEEENSLITSFNIAYDTLNPNGSASSFSSLGGMENGFMSMQVEGGDLSNLVNGGEISGSSGLAAGIRLAMHLQDRIISTAVSLLERNAVTSLSHFRYAYLNTTSQGINGGMAFSSNFQNEKNSSSSQYSSHIFAKPLALTKLAHFLMDMQRVKKKWTGLKARPLILMAEKPQTQTYIVVGYEYPENRGETRKNRFGQNFELAAKTMQGSFKIDSSESNVIEVDSHDVQRFIEQLHYMIDNL